MSYVRSLKDILQEKNTALFNRLSEIEKQARNVLQYAQAKFPYYTPHGFHHSEIVLENLNWLMSEELKMELNGCELFFLIISAWLHDWGLVGEPHEKPEEIRENHHIRTEEKFEKFHALIGVHQNESRIIGRICRGHRIEDLYDEKYDDTPYESGVIIHRRFLAAALRVADEIDVTAGRVPEIIFYSLNPTEKAEEEFKKQMNIIGIAYPSDKERYKLMLSAIAWDPVGVTVLNELKNKIQQELNAVKTILATGINGKGIPLDYVDLKVDTRGFMKDSIEFELDREKILELLIGRALYSRKDVAIRELIQNSIDACRLRKSMEGDYPAEIVVTVDGNSITVEDNGIGMDFKTAKNYLSLIGSSFYSSAEFQKLISQARGFDPISRWGLGILSCFLISSNVIIETKRADTPPCRFIISRVNKGWRYETGSMKKCGTKVTVILNDEGHLVDAEKALDYHIKVPEFPIFIQKGDERRKFAPRWNPEMPENIEPSRIKAIEEAVKRHGKPTVSFTYHSDNELFEATHYGYDWKGGLINLYFRDNLLTCFQGIQMRVPHGFGHSFGSNIVTLLNIKKNVIDYEVSREYIVANERLHNLIRKVFLDYFDKIVNDFESHEQTRKSEIYEKEFEFARFLSSRVDKWYLEDTEMLHFVLERPTAILSKEGWRFDKLVAISGYRPKRVVLVKKHPTAFLNYGQLKEHLDVFKTLIQPHLKEKELAILFIFPYTGNEDSERMLQQTLQQFFLKHEIECEFTDLHPYVVASSQKVKTSIDGILPDECHFAKLPKEYKEQVVRVRSFAPLDSTDEELSRLLKMDGEFLLFLDMPRVFNEISIYPRISNLSSGNHIVKGEYWISVDDSFIQTLINNSDKILAEKTLKEAAKIYVRTLAGTFFIDPEASGIFYGLNAAAKHMITDLLESERQPDSPNTQF